AELEAQFQEIMKLHETVEGKYEKLKKERDNEDLIDSLAYKLHNLYTAYEDLFKIIAYYFENQIEDPRRYHTMLLKRMTLEIEGVRPFLLSQDTFRILNELRAFRHFFRHAYGYEIEGQRVMALAEKTLALKNLFTKDYRGFLQKIKNI
ncbi:MAG: hypothetical protein D6778_05035, partial [Nitrospirae bacterium]